MSSPYYVPSGRLPAQAIVSTAACAPCVVIQGSDEATRGEVQVKDLVEGARAAAAIKSNEEWKAARPAQVSVPEADLVSTVKDILGRHR